MTDKTKTLAYYATKFLYACNMFYDTGPSLGLKTAFSPSLSFSTFIIGLVSSQVYYWRFKCNIHNNYNYVIKTKWNYYLEIVNKQREEAPSKVGLGLK